MPIVDIKEHGFHTLLLIIIVAHKILCGTNNERAL